jgi:hypothetical protein
MHSYAETLRGGAGGLRGRLGNASSPRQLHESPLNHVPALNTNALFVDLRSVKADFSMDERNDFLLKDLGCKFTDIKGIFPDPSTLLLRISFASTAIFERFRDRLAAGVAWAACGNSLVYGWAPGDSVTAVRVSAVPDCFTAEDIRRHFQQFGRVTRAVRGHDRFFKNAYNGIVHLSITLTPGFTLPHFVEVVDDGGAIATRLFVHTDDHRRRCARCGHTGHVGQYCKAGSRAPGADAALWSALQIPPTLLPQPAEEMEGDVDVAQPARPQGPPLTDWAADVEIEAAGVVFSANDSVSSVDASGDRINVSIPVAAGQAAASLDAAPAAGAAASTVDPPPVDPSSVDPSPLPSPSPSPSPAPSPSPLLLQLSTSSASVFSLPLGQGKTSSTLEDASVISLPLSSPSPSPISSVSSSSSQKMDRSRSPRPKRSASVISREFGVDDLTGPAAGRPATFRGRSGGKGGLPKAAKVSSPVRGKTPPSQKIEDSASP